MSSDGILGNCTEYCRDLCVGELRDRAKNNPGCMDPSTDYEAPCTDVCNNICAAPELHGASNYFDYYKKAADIIWDTFQSQGYQCYDRFGKPVVDYDDIAVPHDSLPREALEFESPEPAWYWWGLGVAAGAVIGGATVIISKNPVWGWSLGTSVAAGIIAFFTDEEPGIS